MIKQNRVLIIEEDEAIIRLYKRMVENNTKEQIHIKVLNDVESIDNFIEDFDITEKEKYSLVLSEIEIKGTDITKKLEKIKLLLRNTHLYVLSNNITIERLKSCLKFGADDWIEKPVTNEEFDKIMYNSLFKGYYYEKRIEDLKNEIINLDVNNKIEYYKIKNQILNLLWEFPSNPIGHFLLADLYNRTDKKELAKKHYNAANVLENDD
ncbi:response regulator [Geotoga petraea]|uniref:Response regulator receiver domain-containing protein n=1 Tax=Geotoga petraea TaxID=28234 RepID=A0A1G6JYE4_9BACT|nr:response regulator [Geotoga petraea]SDC23809.1 Response regulator receiver domain-containing protein [Geotoga petraea]